MATRNSDIQIVYKYVGGAHFFSSRDERARGLCVANRDLGKAFNEVGRQLKILAKVNRNEELDLAPAVSVDEFRKWLVTTLKRMLDDKPGRVTPTLSSQLPWEAKERVMA